MGLDAGGDVRAITGGCESWLEIDVEKVECHKIETGSGDQTRRFGPRCRRGSVGSLDKGRRMTCEVV